MKLFLAYFSSFAKEHIGIKQISSYFLFIAIACYINYFSALHNWQLSTDWFSCFIIYAVIFLLTLLFGFYIEFFLGKKENAALVKPEPIVLIAAFLFSFKIVFPSFDLFSLFLPGQFVQQWNLPLYWVGNFLFISLCIVFLHRIKENKWGLYGLKKTSSLWPYIFLLLMMIPLVWFAAQQPDFQQVYPKSKALGSNPSFVNYAVFEISYVIDFFTIELFFRGFLIIALSRHFKTKCILPIALFYFTIHLGKPLAEAISSFFGGALLGLISYYTKSIWGGWVVHAGIALLMELFGYLF